MVIAEGAVNERWAALGGVVHCSAAVDSSGVVCREDAVGDGRGAVGVVYSAASVVWLFSGIGVSGGDGEAIEEGGLVGFGGGNDVEAVFGPELGGVLRFGVFCVISGEVAGEDCFVVRRVAVLPCSSAGWESTENGHTILELKGGVSVAKCVAGTAVGFVGAFCDPNLVAG